MSDKSALKRRFPAEMPEASLKAIYQFMTGEAEPEQALLDQASFAMSNFPNARTEVFRAFADTPNFYWNSRDFLPLIVNQILRLRVNDKVRPPKVNVFCVGAPRCGTTTLSLMLAENPKVYGSSVKETDFFSHIWDGAVPDGVPLDLYDFYYYGWDGQPVLTDFSPLYMRHPHAIDGIKAYNPDARIIACLRDPTDRALSAFFYTRPFHKCENPLDHYGDAIDAGKLVMTGEEEWFSAAALLRQSFYSDDLDYIKARFEDVLIVPFSAFRDLRALNDKVCAFIGVEAGDISSVEQFDAPVNASAKQEGPEVTKARKALKAFFAEEYKKLGATYGKAFLKAIK